MKVRNVKVMHILEILYKISFTYIAAIKKSKHPTLFKLNYPTYKTIRLLTNGENTIDSLSKLNSVNLISKFPCNGDSISDFKKR